MAISEEAASLMKRITSASEKSSSFQSAVDILIKEISAYTGWEYGEFWLPDIDGNQLKNFYVYHKNKSLFNEFEKFSLLCKFAKNVGLVGRVWQKQKPVWDNKLSIESDFLRYDLSRKASIKSAMGFYLELNRETPAVLIFFQLMESDGANRYFNIISELSSPLGEFLNTKLS